MGDGDSFKGLCTVHRIPVGADRQGDSVDLRIFISSDWRSMGDLQETRPLRYGLGPEVAYIEM